MKAPTRSIGWTLPTLLFSLGCGAETVVDPPNPARTRPSTAFGNYSEWSAPVNLGPEINTQFPDQGPYVSRDGLTLYFASQRPAPESFGGNDIYVSTRKNKHHPWGPGVNLGNVINTSGIESTPALSPDEDLLYFATNGRGGTTGLDIWVSTRLDKKDPLAWGAPVRLEGGINSAANDLGPAPFYDSRTKTLTLYFYSVRSGGMGCRDLYGSTQGANGEFGAAVPIAELNTSSEDEQPAIRADGLEMLFVSSRPATTCLGPGMPGGEIYVSTRASTSEPWGPPVNLGAPVNTLDAEGRPALSRDARQLYFFSNGHGGEGNTDLFVSTRTRLDDGEDGEDQIAE